ncbi:uncharacterized protein [Physcomitrium patens]|uniref:Tyrosine-specific transport protein n=1 Tax=Physcomitrium patens TaxID=3218 RepID=A0A7I4A652_PHYPA|nr:uncharacterized protein LOC112288070 isoform X2 [Physcomitrium patens]|eukprot:XP_024387662.1 uncharacterized protein LOC112288070 isoform X2 [Physcomitrella patens]
MTTSLLSHGAPVSFTSSRRSQKCGGIGKILGGSPSRLQCSVVSCGSLGLNVRVVLKGEQSRTRSSRLTSHNYLLSSKRTLLQDWWRRAVGGNTYHVWLRNCVHGTPLYEESVDTDVSCHAQVNPEAWSIDDESLPPHELSTLSRPDSERSGRVASAIGLIMGTAVGPGILGLPAATLRAGLIPSSVTIVAVWAYVMASILLVAELSYAVMAEQGGVEVSFTGLAVRTLGHSAGRVVALVYALLNYALLVACVAGLHSILTHWLPLPSSLVCMLSPGVVISMLAVTSLQTVDVLNRALCGLMLASITCLVGIGISVSRNIWLGSTGFGTLSLSALHPAIPVIVLTLGFHVIIPVVCRVLGGNPQEARKAILCGGTVPLLMVLSWNTVILGLAQAPAGASMASFDAIKLLLSLSSSAAPVVQAFAFSALGTTLIGYALSFPKQLLDTVSLFFIPSQGVEREKAQEPDRSRRMAALLLAMVPPVIMAMTSPTAFASALDFAGVYANCYLFGVLPPIMAWVYRYQQPQADQELSNRYSEDFHSSEGSY